MNEKTSHVHWEGAGKKGQGLVSTETGALKDYPYGFASRFEDDRRGTNPEEILGAAHAACFTMAFSFACDKAGFATGAIDTQCDVRLARQGDGFLIERIALRLSASVAGIDDARFQEIAQAAKRDCPLSRALAAVPVITLQATRTDGPPCAERAPSGAPASATGAAATDAVAPAGAGAEIPAVAAAEARAVAPPLVRSVDAVARSRLLTVGPDAPLAEVAALLSGAQIGMVLVCDASGMVGGVITETILVQQLGAEKAGIFTTRAGDVMTREFTVCVPDDTLSGVLAMMHERGVIHVAIVDADRKPLGVLNARDGLRALLAAGNHEESLLRNYVLGIGYQ